MISAGKATASVDVESLFQEALQHGESDGAILWRFAVVVHLWAMTQNTKLVKTLETLVQSRNWARF